MALFDETQALEDDFDLDEESILEIDGKRKVATLNVTNNDAFPTPFPIYTGQNIVGRHEKADVCIPIKALSKKHACIEVLGDQHFISDFGSKNRTRRGKLVLPPNVKYELTDGCVLTFGNVMCTYGINDDGKADDTDSLSDLYSDSMIPDDSNENLPHDEEDGDVSYDALQAQPTQPVHTPVLFSSQIGEKRKYRENVEEEAVFVADSEPQDDDKKMDILQGNSFCLVKETPDYRFDNTEKKPSINQVASPPRMDASHLLLIRESDDDDSLCSEPIDIPGGNANQMATNTGNTSRSNSQDYAVMATQAYGVADRIDESTDIEDNDILKETLILDKTTDSVGKGSDDDDATDMEDDELEKGDKASERDKSTANADDTKKLERSSSSTTKRDETSDDCYDEDTDIEDNTSEGGRSISIAADTGRSSVTEKGNADVHKDTRSSRVMLTSENQNKMTDIELSLINSKAGHSEMDESSGNDSLTVKDTPEKESESDVPFDTMPVGTQQLEVNTLPGGVGRNPGGKRKGARAFALDYDVDWNQPTQPYCNEIEATQAYAAGMEATQAYGSGMEATQAYGVGNEATEAQTFDINAATQAYNDDGKDKSELNSEEDSVEATSSRSDPAATQAYSIDLNAPTQPYPGDFNAAAKANGSDFNAATQAYSGDFNAATQAYSNDFNAPTQPGDFDAATQAYNGDFNGATQAYSGDYSAPTQPGDFNAPTQAYSGDYSAPTQPYSGDLNAATQESTDTSPCDEPTQAYKDDFDMATLAYNEETVLSRHHSNSFKDTSKPSSAQADSNPSQTYTSDTTQPYRGETSSTRQELSSYGNEQIQATQAYGTGNKTQGNNELDSSIHESSCCGIEAPQEYYGDTVPVGELGRGDFDDKPCSSSTEATQGYNRSNLTRQDSNSDGFEATQAYYGDTVPLKRSVGDGVDNRTQSCSDSNAATLVYNEDADLVKAGSSSYGDETQAYGKELKSVAVEPKSVTIDSKSDKVEPNLVTVEPKSVVVEPKSVAVEPKSVAVEPKSAVVEPTSVTIETTSVDNNQANQDDASSEISSLTSKIADKTCESNIGENQASNKSSRAKRSTRTNTRKKGSISIEPLKTGDMEGLQEKDLSSCQNDEPATAKPARGRRRKAVKGKSTENDSTALENSLTESLESILTNDIGDQQSKVKPAIGRRRRTMKDESAEGQIKESNSTSLQNSPSNSMESLQSNDIHEEQSEVKPARGRRRRTTKDQSTENDLTLAKVQIDESSSTSLKNRPSDSMESLQSNDKADQQSKAKSSARGLRGKSVKGQSAENDLTFSKGQIDDSNSTSLQNAPSDSMESLQITDIKDEQSKPKATARGRRGKSMKGQSAENDMTLAKGQIDESSSTSLQNSPSDSMESLQIKNSNDEQSKAKSTARGRRRRTTKDETTESDLTLAKGQNTELKGQNTESKGRNIESEGQNTESKGQNLGSTSRDRMRKSVKTNSAGDGSLESSRQQITLEEALSISASNATGDVRANQDISQENDRDIVKTNARGGRRKTKTDNNAGHVSTETGEQGMESQQTIPIEETRLDEKSHTNESPKNNEPASVKPTSRSRRRKTVKAEISSTESLIESESITESESINAAASSSMEMSESVKQTKSRKKSNRITMPETNLDESSVESPGRKKRGRSSTFDSEQSDRSKRQCVRAKPKVLFTGLLDQTIETWKRQPWANFTDSVYDATHLVTDKIRRSVKFLCCLSRGINIVSPHWLESCRNAQKVIPDDDYTVDDKELEKKYDFKLKHSIALASETGLLNGFEVFVTKNVKPDPKQMKDIIQCAGGKAISKLSSVKNDKTLIITCEEDQNEVKKIADSAKSLYNAELLLTGILQQKLKLDSFRFDWDLGKTPAKRARKK